MATAGHLAEELIPETVGALVDRCGDLCNPDAFGTCLEDLAAALNMTSAE